MELSDYNSSPQRSGRVLSAKTLKQVQLNVLPEAGSLAKVYGSVAELKGYLPADCFENVRLLVSELVTNSIRHAGLGPEDRIRLNVLVLDRLVRGEVHDPGPGFAVPETPEPRSDLGGGWGLYIVHNVSNRWGIKRNDGHCVWFEIET